MQEPIKPSDFSLKGGRPLGTIVPKELAPKIYVGGIARLSPVMMASKNDGLLHFDFVLTSSGANENDQYFVDDEIARPDIYLNPVNEAIDEDHDQGFKDIRGEITSSIYEPATSEHPSCIACTGVIFENIYPEVAYKLRRGAGKWAAVSMEALPNPLERIGKYLVIHNPKFVGAGIVRFPGNKWSQIRDIDGTAIEQTKENTMEKDPLRLKANIAYQLLTANIKR